MLELLCFRDSSSNTGKRAQADPTVSALSKPVTDSHKADFNLTYFCWGKQSFVCPESLSVSALQVIQLEVLLRIWLCFLYDERSLATPPRYCEPKCY